MNDLRSGSGPLADRDIVTGGPIDDPATADRNNPRWAEDPTAPSPDAAAAGWRGGDGTDVVPPRSIPQLPDDLPDPQGDIRSPVRTGSPLRRSRPRSRTWAAAGRRSGALGGERRVGGALRSRRRGMARTAARRRTRPRSPSKGSWRSAATTSARVVAAWSRTPRWRRAATTGSAWAGPRLGGRAAHPTRQTTVGTGPAGARRWVGAPQAPIDRPAGQGPLGGGLALPAAERPAGPGPRGTRPEAAVRTRPDGTPRRPTPSARREPRDRLGLDAGHLLVAGVAARDEVELRAGPRPGEQPRDVRRSRQVEAAVDQHARDPGEARRRSAAARPPPATPRARSSA